MSVDLDKKVMVENLCNWKLGFKRINSIGDISIQPKSRLNISAGEIIAQCHANNRLFVGEDGRGSHARIFIHDSDVRIEAELEDAETKQIIVTDDELKALFDLKTISTFKKRVKEIIVSHAEKNSLAEYAIKNQINDHQKLVFIEEYTGFHIDNT